MKNTPYFKQTELMLQVVPYVAEEKYFALKGGTAINFFVRNMPRLSVDIDLTYVPLLSREVSLKNIGQALKRVAQNIKGKLPHLKIQEGFEPEFNNAIKLMVKNDTTKIVVEVNSVIRGTIFPCVERDLVPKAEELFNMSTRISNLSTADLYGGKICAAMDRQHPRDLFDIKILLENEGLTDEIRKAFVAYWASHDSPMSAMINPPLKNIRDIHETHFSGMTTESASYDDLIHARKMLIATLQKDLTSSERQFLVSLKEGNPNWDLMGIPHLATLPAIQWKLANIRKMPKKKHAEDLEKLRKVLGV